MTTTPLVSIIIPVYNVEQYIEKCITSILSQTLTNFECLIIDDGSYDKSIEIAKDIINNDKRFVFLKKKNGGQASARNMGLDYAQGEYISFIDSDDYVDSEFLHLMYNEILKDMSDICICNVQYVSLKGLDIKQFKNDVTEHQRKKDYFNSFNTISNFLCDKLFHKSCFDSIRLDTNMRTNEDVYVVFRLLYEKKLCNVERALYNYLQRPGSTSKAIHPTYFADRVKIKDSQLMFAKKYGIDAKYPDYIVYTYLKTFVHYTISTFATYSIDYSKDIEQLLEHLKVDGFYTFRNIVLVIKKDKKAGLTCLIFKISPISFNYLYNLWLKHGNHPKK
ncbi:glycosyltransferase family 2 protein [Psychrobacter sanguinis]|uniref:Glycosyltransferase n=1 Tax=Psychrobacter sanguinis TaxID=861445 RepID=A0A844LYC6_9GAMM|nr:glycosyltransferase family 2 protein [Psychrobacter sanguinis]MUG31584.1 glycosyltransferase [Psychrobacter sanguinis]